MSSTIKPSSPSHQQIEPPNNINETSTSAQSSHTNIANLNNTQILNNSSIEIDNQFILRMPVIKQENGTYKLHKSTIALKELLEKVQSQQQEDNKNEDGSIEQVDPLKDRLFIELNTETRKGRVKFDDEIFEARLVDLPCIIESLKTTDKKTFYKTGDICQMLVCRTQDDPWNTSDEEQDQSKLNKLKKQVNQYYDPTNPALSHLRKYLWSHGITPPLKNVRRKRFRKIVRKKTVDYADIEKEVKQLFRADRDAVKIDYEVTYVDADSAEFLDDDDQVNDLIKSNDEYSSQDENTINKSFLNEDQKSQKATASRAEKQPKPSKGGDNNDKKTSFKSKEIIEESNMSSEMYDESSMMKSNQNYDENTTNNGYNDEDESNMSNVNEKSSNTNNNNNRTNFKNLFVKQVIGDLSSSSDEDEDDRKTKNEDDDEDLDNKSKEIGQDESESNLEPVVMPKTSLYDTNDNNEYDEMDNQVSNNRNNKNDNNKDFEDLSISSSSSSSSSSATSNKSSDKNELKEKLNRLMDELDQIKGERKRREDEINAIPNPALRKHLQSRLNNLIEDENKKMDEIEELKSNLANLNE
jgi:transcription initiation factor TFIID subunit 7